MQSEVGMVTSAPAVRRMRRFVPHAGLKMAVTASELSSMPDSSPGHGGGIQELNKRLTDMKMASNQDTVLRRESTFSNYWSMKSDHSRRNSQVCISNLIDNLISSKLYIHRILYSCILGALRTSQTK